MLRHVTLIDDEPCAVTEFTEVRINPPIADLEFEFVPHPEPMSSSTSSCCSAWPSSRGPTSPGSIGRTPGAVQAAIHDTMRPDRPIPEVRLEEQRAKHVPVGDPPDDEAAARPGSNTPSPTTTRSDKTGTALVKCSGGEGLAGHAAGSAAPGPGAGRRSSAHRGRRHRVPAIGRGGRVVLRGGRRSRFPMVNGREGRAVRVGDRWLIEHATLVDLLRFARVIVHGRLRSHLPPDHKQTTRSRELVAHGGSRRSLNCAVDLVFIRSHATGTEAPSRFASRGSWVEVPSSPLS